MGTSSGISFAKQKPGRTFTFGNQNVIADVRSRVIKVGIDPLFGGAKNIIRASFYLEK